MNQTKRIGFIGLGSMGAGMAHCLLRKGHALRVYARRADVAKPFADAGAQVAGSPAALGGDCDLVFLCVSDAPAVEEVLFGAQGLTGTLASGGVVVDTSTIAATDARRFGERLAAKGITLLDAPVSGGQQGARDGTLGCMVGGPKDVVDACREVMGAFCKTITHVGELGAGQTVKACNQVAVSACLLGVVDAIALARAQGIDPALMRDVLLTGSGRSVALERQAQRIIDGDFKPGFRASLMRKDLRIALEAAKATGTVLNATPVVEKLLDDLCRNGGEDADWIAIARRR
ncbi:NAD(P)-dependent oxidoreductase [Ramlibacter albus]|nr:NAD(P)-dependent oxidoreductase [Ramlibacter albus]